MTSDFADRIAATNAWTGVVAVEVLAGHVRGTVGVDDALWLALHVGIALVVGRTGALAVVANATCDGARTTRVRHTWVSYHWLS